MDRSKSDINSQELSEIVVAGMQEKKAIDIVILDLRKISKAVADFFVICSGNSDTHIASIADSVEEFIYKQANEAPWQKEGRENKEWILIDYVSIVVHIFQKDKRSYYELEDLWGDAEITHINSEITNI